VTIEDVLHGLVSGYHLLSCDVRDATGKRGDARLGRQQPTVNGESERWPRDGRVANGDLEKRRKCIETEILLTFPFREFPRTETDGDEQRRESYGSPPCSPAIRTAFTNFFQSPRVIDGLAKARTSTCLLPCSNDAATLRLAPLQPLALARDLAAGDARAGGRAWERRFLGAAGLARWDE
jgi:hypothetical protein